MKVNGHNLLLPIIINTAFTSKQDRKCPKSWTLYALSRKESSQGTSLTYLSNHHTKGNNRNQRNVKLACDSNVSNRKVRYPPYKTLVSLSGCKQNRKVSARFNKIASQLVLLIFFFHLGRRTDGHDQVNSCFLHWFLKGRPNVGTWRLRTKFCRKYFIVKM